MVHWGEGKKKGKQEEGGGAWGKEKRWGGGERGEDWNRNQLYDIDIHSIYYGSGFRVAVEMLVMPD